MPFPRSRGVAFEGNSRSANRAAAGTGFLDSRVFIRKSEAFEYPLHRDNQKKAVNW